jgi:hypothetical protein
MNILVDVTNMKELRMQCSGILDGLEIYTKT